jgi:hypothetical protein
VGFEMVKVELVIKGAKANLVIKGSTFAEVQQEYENNKKKIENLIGGPHVSKTVIEKAKPIPTSIQGRIAALIDTGFFQSPKMAREVKAALKESGYTYDFERVSIGLMRLVRKKYLRRLTEEREGKDVYVYVNP